MIKPVHPVERSEFDGLEMSPQAFAPDDFRFKETDHGFGESIVIRITTAPDRRLDPGVRQALGIFDRDILAAAVAVVD